MVMVGIFMSLHKNKIPKNGNFIVEMGKYSGRPAKGVHLGRISGKVEKWKWKDYTGFELKM